MPTPADRLRCVSVHSVKGGVGKSTLSYLVARRLAEQEPTLLVDLDLTGTSLADVLPLRAPSWTGQAELLPLDRAPDGLPLDWKTTRQRLSLRETAEGAGSLAPRHVPFLNDFFLWKADDPDGRFELDEDVHPMALAWHLPEGDPLRERLKVLPSSALPVDLEHILPLIYDELHAAYLESRLEWLLAFILEKTDVRTVVFDSPPALPGLSRALLSLAMRLPDRIALAKEGGTPLALEQTLITWRALLLVSPDHQDLRAANRWLTRREPDELARIHTVVNLIPLGEEQSFMKSARATLAQGDGEFDEHITEVELDTLAALYPGELLSPEREAAEQITLLPRVAGWRLFQPLADGPPASGTLEDALQSLIERISG